MIQSRERKRRRYSLGLKLKEIRQKKGFALSEVSKNTKIRKIYLEMIENGDFANLPPSVYVKGFVRSYADFLKVDVRDALRLYASEVEFQKRCLEKKQGKKKRKLKDFLPVITIGPGVFVGVVFLLIFVFGFSYFYREINEFARDPRLVIVSPEINTTVQGSRVEISGITDHFSQVTINEKEVFVDDEGRFQQEMNLQSGLNQFTIQSVNKFGGVTQKQVTIESLADNSNPTTIVAGADDEREYLNLELEAREDSIWVTVEADGEVVYDGVVRPEESKKFKSKENFEVFTDKGLFTWVSFQGGGFESISDDVEFKSRFFEVIEEEIEDDEKQAELIEENLSID